MDLKTFNVSITMLGLTALQLLAAQQLVLKASDTSLAANAILLWSLAGAQIVLYGIGFLLLNRTSHTDKKAPAAKHKKS